MGNINVKFIDKNYSIPEDVLLYMELLKLVDSVKEQLVRDFVREVSKSENGLIGDSDMSPYITRQLNRFIAKLCENGIYDRTINDYLKDNKGYQLISNVNKVALEKFKFFLRHKLDALQEGHEDAIQKAESQVTGMGFSIWSSSFVNHAIYAAMQASTINRQAKEATATYQKELSSLHSKLVSEYDRETSQYVQNEYIPNMETAITLFSYELIDKYISDLIANGKFDKITLEFVNIERSNELLDNLNLSENKKAILENAFLACPYNAAVYMAAMRCDLLDVETFQTAKTFKCDDTIISFLESHWGEVSYPKKFKINYDIVEKIAKFTQNDVITILQAKTKEYVYALIKAYQNAFELVSNKEKCHKIIKGFNEKSLLSGEVISIGTAQAQVNSIVSLSIWNQLVNSCGYIDLLEKIKVFLPNDIQLQSKSEIDDFLIEKITVNFEEARQKLATIIENRKKEEKKKKEDEEKKKAEQEKQKAIAKKELKKQLKYAVIVGCIIVLVVVTTAISIPIIKSHQQEHAEIESVETHINEALYDDALEFLMSSSLSDEKKNTYYSSLVEKTDFKTFDVNGLVVNIPEHWYIRDYSDPYIRSASYPEEDSLFQWYIKCMGTVEQVVSNGDDLWERDNGYSPTTIDGCSEAYISRELGEKIDGNIYSTTEYYIICQGFVYKIQYFAYDERYFESEMQMLLDHVEFEQYSDEKIQANRKEQTYLNAVDLLEEGEYEEAITLFEQLGDYKDSEELIDTANSLQLQQIEDYKASCTEVGYIDDLNYLSSIDVKVYAQVKKHIRNNEYYIITEYGETIEIWNRSSREELIEGEWITIYGNAYGHGDNMTIRVEYIDD